jgi:hypothetical protein
MESPAHHFIQSHQFRANSGLKSQEYSAPVLGLIFLRFTEAIFARLAKLEAQGKLG